MQSRVEQALVEIDARWDRWPTMPERIVAVLSGTLGGCSVAIHHWRDSKIAFDAHNFDRDPTQLAWIADGNLHEARLYDPEEPGIDADRVVAGDELRARDRRRWAMFEDGFLGPMGLGDQVRSLVTGDDGRLLAFIGAFPPRGRRAEPDDIAVFERLLRPLSERMRAWKLLAETSVERAAILDLVSEMRKPAFILSADGALVYANLAARLMYDRPPERLRETWLQASPPPGLRRLTVTEGSRRLYVCLPCEDGVKLERLGLWAAKVWELPSRLHVPAAKVIAGRSDKEIACETRLTHATVRTYIQLIYRHVGVSSRTALAREALRVIYR